MSWTTQTPSPPLAGWWYRVAATLIDAIIVSVPSAIVLGSPSSRTVVTEYVSLGILGIVYSTLLLATRGQTVGMMALGTRCIDAITGANLTPGKALARGVVSQLFGLAIVLPLLDLLWPLWDRQNQTLHDKVVGSLVVMSRQGQAAPPFPPTGPNHGQVPGSWGAGTAGGAPGLGWPATPTTVPAPETPPKSQGSWLPASWYPDPSIPGQERWWDGKSWTEHTRPRV